MTIKKYLAPILFFIGSALVFGISFSRFSLLKEHFEVFSHLRMGAVLLSFLFLLAVYGLIFWRYKPHLKLIYFLPSIALLFIALPFMSQDIYGYLVSGYNFSHLHINPYQIAPTDVLDNQWLGQLNEIWWLKEQFAYGPLFLLMPSIAAVVGFGNLLVSLYAYKLLALGGYIASIWLLHRLVEGKNRDKIVLLWAINPAVLIHVLTEGHNDIFMIVFLLLVFYLVKKSRYKYGVTAFAASVLIKYNSLIFLPILWFKDSKLKIKRAIGSTVSLVAMLAVMMLIPGLSLGLIFGNVSHIISDYCLYSCSPVVYASRAITSSSHVHEIIRLSLFAILYALAAWRLLIYKYQPFKFIYTASIVFIFVAITWISPWYLLVPISFALMCDDKDSQIIAYLATVYSLLHFFRL